MAAPRARVNKPVAMPSTSGKASNNKKRLLSLQAFSISSLGGALSKFFRASWRPITKFFDRPRGKALGRCCLHIPPLAITCALLTLNFLSTYYENPGTPYQNIQFNVLQFAAKFHELLIGASLSLVAVNYAQYELRNGRGLSLDEILVGFQISNLNALWKLNIYKTTRRNIPRFLFLVVVLIIMATAVGPSSAILMLPALGWWDRMYETEFRPSPTSIYVIATEPTLWPSRITVDNFFPAGCNVPANFSSIPEHCPHGGISTILSQESGSQVDGDFDFNLSITVTSSSNSAYYRTLWSQVGCLDSVLGQDVVCYCSRSTSSSVGAMLQTASQYSSLGDKQAKYSLSQVGNTKPLGPQALSLCLTNVISHALLNSTPLHFRTRQDLDWTADSTPLITLWENIQSSNPVWNSTAALWFEAPDFGVDNPSIGAAFMSSNNGTNGTYGDEVLIITCSIYASWVPAESYIVPYYDNYIHTSLNEKEQDISMATLEQESKVQLDLEWVNFFFPPSDTFLPLALQMGPAYDANPNALKYLDSSSAGQAVSVFIADSLARVSMDLGMFAVFDPSQTFTNQTYQGNQGTDLLTLTWAIPPGHHDSPHIPYEALQPENVTEILVKASINGYSYSMHGTTRALAAAILLLHVLIALLHVILVTTYGWGSPNPNSLHDVLVMALRSSPSDVLESNSINGKQSHKNKSVFKVNSIEDSHVPLPGDVEDGIGEILGKQPPDG